MKDLQSRHQKNQFESDGLDLEKKYQESLHELQTPRAFRLNLCVCIQID